VKTEKIWKAFFDWTFLGVVVLCLIAFQWAFPKMLLQTNDSPEYLKYADVIIDAFLLPVSELAESGFMPLFPFLLALVLGLAKSVWIIHFFLIIAFLLAIRDISVVFFKTDFYRIIFLFASAFGVHTFLMAGLLLPHLLVAALFAWSFLFVIDVTIERPAIYKYTYAIGMSLLVLLNHQMIVVALGVASWMYVRKDLQLHRKWLFLLPIGIYLVWRLVELILSGGLFFAFAWSNLLAISERLCDAVMPMQEVTVGLKWISFLAVGVGLAIVHILIRKKLPYYFDLLPIILGAYLAAVVLEPNFLSVNADLYLAPVIWLNWLWFLKMLERIIMYTSPLTRIFIGVLLILWMSYPIYRSWHNLQAWHERNHTVKVQTSAQNAI
jgi:hypothetical protein